MRHDRKATMTEVDKLLVDSFIQPGDINRGGSHSPVDRSEEHVESTVVKLTNGRMKKEKSMFRNKFK